MGKRESKWKVLLRAALCGLVCTTLAAQPIGVLRLAWAAGDDAAEALQQSAENDKTRAEEELKRLAKAYALALRERQGSEATEAALVKAVYHDLAQGVTLADPKAEVLAGAADEDAAAAAAKTDAANAASADPMAALTAELCGKLENSEDVAHAFSLVMGELKIVCLEVREPMAEGAEPLEAAEREAGEDAYGLWHGNMVKIDDAWYHVDVAHAAKRYAKDKAEAADPLEVADAWLLASDAGMREEARREAEAAGKDAAAEPELTWELVPAPEGESLPVEELPAADRAYAWPEEPEEEPVAGEPTTESAEAAGEAVQNPVQQDDAAEVAPGENTVALEEPSGAPQDEAEEHSGALPASGTEGSIGELTAATLSDTTLDPRVSAAFNKALDNAASFDYGQTYSTITGKYTYFLVEMSGDSVPELVIGCELTYTGTGYGDNGPEYVTCRRTQAIVLQYDAARGEAVQVEGTGLIGWDPYRLTDGLTEVYVDQVGHALIQMINHGMPAEYANAVRYTVADGKLVASDMGTYSNVASHGDLAYFEEQLNAKVPDKTDSTDRSALGSSQALDTPTSGECGTNCVWDLDENGTLTIQPAPGYSKGTLDLDANSRYADLVEAYRQVIEHPSLYDARFGAMPQYAAALNKYQYGFADLTGDGVPELILGKGYSVGASSTMFTCVVFTYNDTTKKATCITCDANTKLWNGNGHLLHVTPDGTSLVHSYHTVNQDYGHTETWTGDNVTIQGSQLVASEIEDFNTKRKNLVVSDVRFQDCSDTSGLSELSNAPVEGAEFPWIARKNEIVSVVVKDTVESGDTLNRLFAGCANLKTVDLTGLDTVTNPVSYTSELFEGCTSIREFKVSSRFDKSKTGVIPAPPSQRGMWWSSAKRKYLSMRDIAALDNEDDVFTLEMQQTSANPDYGIAHVWTTIGGVKIDVLQEVRVLDVSQDDFMDIDVELARSEVHPKKVTLYYVKDGDRKILRENTESGSFEGIRLTDLKGALIDKDTNEVSQVFVSITDENGVIAMTKPLLFSVVDPDGSSLAGLKLYDKGLELSFKIPIGGSKQEFKHTISIDELKNAPFSVQYNPDTGKMTFGFNLTKQALKSMNDAGHTDLKKYLENEEPYKSIIKGKYLKFGGHGAKLKSEIGKRSFDFWVYGESVPAQEYHSIDSSQVAERTEGPRIWKLQVVVSVGIEVSGSAQTAVLSVPVVFEATVGAKLKADGSATFKPVDGFIDVTGAPYAQAGAPSVSFDLVSEAEGTLKLYGGIGVKLLSGGLYNNTTLNAKLKILPQLLSDGVTLDGNWGLRLNVLGFKKDFELGKYNCLKIDGQSSIEPNSYKPQALIGQEIMAAAADTDSYEPVPRNYQASSWSGVTSSAAYTKLQDNVYPDSEVRLVEVAGGALMTYLTDDTTRNASNRSLLMWTRYDAASETWSEPQPVWQDGTADFMPSLCSDGAGGAWIVWDNSRVALEEGSSLSEVASHIDVAAAHFKGSTGSVSDISFVSNNGNAFEYHVAVGMSKGSPVIAWSENGLNDVLGITGSHAIMFATKSGTSWNVAKADTVTGLISGVAAGDLGGNEAVSWSRDADSSYLTTDDLSICLWSGGSTSTIASGYVWQPCFTRAEGIGALTWCDNGTLMYTTTGFSANKLVEGIPSTDYQLTGDVLDDAMVTYVCAEGGTTDVLGRRGAGDSWSDEVIFVYQDQSVVSWDADYVDGSPLFAYSAASVSADGADNAAIWSVGSNALGMAALGPISYGDGKVTATVTNIGAEPLPTVTILATEGTTTVAQNIQRLNLAPGDSAELELPLAEPNDNRRHTYQISYSPAPHGVEAQELVLGEASLAIAMTHHIVDGAESVTATVTNNGKSPSSAGKVVFYNYDTDAVLHEAPLAAINAGQSVECTYQDSDGLFASKGIDCIGARVELADTSAPGHGIWGVTNVWTGVYDPNFFDPDAPGFDTRSMEDVEVSLKDQTYTGKALEPTVTVTYAGRTVPASNYTLSYKNNTNVGTATVTITGDGTNYQGTITKTFKINKAQLSLLTVPNLYYTGKALNPNLTVQAGSTRVNAGYSVTYAVDSTVVGNKAKLSGGKPMAAGAYIVTVKGTNSSCSGTLSKRFNVYPGRWERLWGQNALNTMSSIVRADGVFTASTVNTVVVAGRTDFKGALSGTGLAGLYKAPLLITDVKSLSGVTKTELQRLRPKTVLVVGNKSVVSDATFTAIKKALPHATVTRVSGASASATAIAVNNQGKKAATKWGKTAIVATQSGYKDALSIAPYAYAKHAPIFFTESTKLKDGKGLSAASLNAIKAGGFTKVIIVGGPVAVPASVETALKGKGIQVQRIGGSNGIDTSRLIAQFALSQGMTLDHMAIATTKGYADALTGAALSGAENSVIVLADPTGGFKAFDGVFRYDSLVHGHVYGGPVAISKSSWTYFTHKR